MARKRRLLSRTSSRRSSCRLERLSPSYSIQRTTEANEWRRSKNRAMTSSAGTNRAIMFRHGVSCGSNASMLRINAGVRTDHDYGSWTEKTYRMESETVEIDGVGPVKIVSGQDRRHHSLLPQYVSRPATGRDPRTHRTSMEHRDPPPGIGREVRIQAVRSRAQASHRAVYSAGVSRIDAGYVR